jgi:hypothetical protein
MLAAAAGANLHPYPTARQQAQAPQQQQHTVLAILTLDSRMYSTSQQFRQPQCRTLPWAVALLLLRQQMGRRTQLLQAQQRSRLTLWAAAQQQKTSACAQL